MLLQIDQVDISLRNSMWSVYIEKFLSDVKQSFLQERFEKFGRDVWMLYYKQPIDTLPIDDYGTIDIEWLCGYLRDYFFGDRVWYEYYDFLEFCAQYSSADFICSMNEVLEREKSLYRFIGNQIVPISDEMELNGIEEALAESDQYALVNKHIARSLTMLADRSNPDFRNSVKEAVSSVESMCKVLTLDKKATMGTALAKLELNGAISPALKRSFSALYGYASDEGGIRHALTDGNRQIDFIEAKFILTVCCAFVNFLKGNHDLNEKGETLS